MKTNKKIKLAHAKQIKLALACVVLFAASVLLQACGGASSEQAATPQQHQPTAATPRNEQTPQTSQVTPETAHAGSAQQTTAAADSHDGHSHGAAGRVPHFALSAADLKNLPPVLSAAQFTGKTRMAYAAVKEIPQTIAQIPCYCYCDEGFGHKSLQTCFTDEHAAHCAVCVEEALLAYRLQKEERLTPAQIRERIVAQYGGQ
ncbi:MAG TPA: CYCXC family (seleno)protein [Pyrinomonadaceae bacterium]|nr:CYCXC family (seleno)protein [Pyrinomonadaceae bacterium]